ncbi:MAG: hypothetical protein JXB05_03820 [Myxococcaceae bacterium]|nr:hypothetical protein [Myxococcaceae bacterium]
MHRGWGAAVFAAALGVGSAASAHEFECVKHVNGQLVARVDEYPTRLRFDYLLTNLHPSLESVAERVEDPVLAGYGWRFKYPTPLAVPVGGSAETEFLLQVGSYEDCKALAARDGADDGVFDTTFRVVWPLGEDQCIARLVCDPPFEPPPPPPPCEVDGPCAEPLVTRDEGFFKIHESALQQCLDAAPIELGGLGVVSTLPQALGVLWGSPTLYRDNMPRGAVDAARFLLARQYLVAHCNYKLFTTLPADPFLLENAWQALSGTQCQAMGTLRLKLRKYNAAWRHNPLPGDFDPGLPTPSHAESIADDFTQPSGLSCADGQ